METPPQTTGSSQAMGLSETMGLSPLSGRRPRLPKRLPRRFWIVAASVVYTVSLHFAYIYYLCPIFSATNWVYQPRSPALVAIAWICALLPSLWLRDAIRRPSSVAASVLYPFLHIPACIIPTYMDLDIEPTRLATLILVLTCCFSALTFCDRLPPLKLPTVRLPAVIFWGAVAALGLAGYATLIRLFGLRYHAPTVAEVYGVRDEFAIALDERGGAFAGYIVNWLSEVVNPLLIVWGAMHRRYWLVVIGAVGSYFMYAVSGMKSAPFSVPAMLLGVYLVLRYRRRLTTAIMMGSVALVLVSMLIDSLTHDIVMSNFVLRRRITTPGIMTGLYFDYFSSHPKAMLGYGLFKAFGDYPYELKPPDIIGEVYFPWGGSHANAHPFLDAYANFGIGGMAVFTGIWMLFLWAFDSVGRDRRKTILSALAVLRAALKWMDVSLLTSMLTHGGGLWLLLVLVAPHQRLRPRRAWLRLRRPRRASLPLASRGRRRIG